jgi:hypothetical protein
VPFSLPIVSVQNVRPNKKNLCAIANVYKRVRAITSGLLSIYGHLPKNNMKLNKVDQYYGLWVLVL